MSSSGNQAVTEWYETVYCVGRIDAIEVVKETDKSVVVKTQSGHKHMKRKRTEYSAIFPTREEAVGHMCDYLELQVAGAQRKVDYYERKLDGFTRRGGTP